MHHGFRDHLKGWYRQRACLQKKKFCEVGLIVIVPAMPSIQRHAAVSKFGLPAWMSAISLRSWYGDTLLRSYFMSSLKYKRFLLRGRYVPYEILDCTTSLFGGFETHLIKWLLLSNTRRLVTSRLLWLPWKFDILGNVTTLKILLLQEMWLPEKCEFPGMDHCIQDGNSLGQNF